MLNRTSSKKRIGLSNSTSNRHVLNDSCINVDHLTKFSQFSLVIQYVQFYRSQGFQ